MAAGQPQVAVYPQWTGGDTALPVHCSRGACQDTGPWTKVNDAFFARLLPALPEGELRAFLYLVRRTWGYKRPRDHVSLSQFLSGVRTRDGTIADRGCGIKSRDTLLAALRALEARGAISIARGVKGATHAYTILLPAPFGDGTEGPVPPWSPLPNALLDEHLATLGYAELKMLLYILFQTWGEQRAGAAIARRSFSDGAGLRSKETITSAKKSLLDRRLITEVRKRSAGGADEATHYVPLLPLPRGFTLTDVLADDAGMTTRVEAKDSSQEDSKMAYGVRQPDQVGPAAVPQRDTAWGTIRVPRGLRQPYQHLLPDPLDGVRQPDQQKGTKEKIKEKQQSGEDDGNVINIPSLSDVTTSPPLAALLGIGVHRDQAQRLADSYTPAHIFAVVGDACTRCAAGTVQNPAGYAVYMLMHDAVPQQPALANDNSDQTSQRQANMDTDEAIRGDDIWRAACQEMRGTMTRENFERWFQPVEGHVEGKVLRLSVPDTSHAWWLSERLRRVIDRALHQQGHAHLDVVCTVRTMTDDAT